MITVLGASGNTGGEVARRLLAAGVPVRAVGRSADRLAKLVDAGATPCVGDATDLEFLVEAFRGADGAYTLLPYDPHAADYLGDQQRLGETLVRAIEASGLPRAVALSSVGADVPGGTGFIASLHDHEQRLRRLSGVDVLVLRAGSFFENFLEVLPVISEIGMHADNVAPDVAIPMIATADIAAAAADALRTRDFSGFAVRELLGPCDLSYTEATTIIGAAIGRSDLPYVQMPDDEFVGVLQEAGFPRAAAELQAELGRALSDGTIVSRQGRTADTTTPTRLQDFLATR